MPNFEKYQYSYEFLYNGMFFILFFGLISDKFHYNNISSKGAAIVYSINIVPMEANSMNS